MSNCNCKLCSLTSLDVYFTSKTVRSPLDLTFYRCLHVHQTVHQMHIDMPLKDSSIETTLPFSTEATGFQSFLNINLSDVVARTNLSFTPLLRAPRSFAYESSPLLGHSSHSSLSPASFKSRSITLACGTPCKIGSSTSTWTVRRFISSTSTRTSSKVLPSMEISHR